VESVFGLFDSVFLLYCDCGKSMVEVQFLVVMLRAWIQKSEGPSMVQWPEFWLPFILQMLMQLG
jgi:hypothetical protein